MTSVKVKWLGDNTLRGRAQATWGVPWAEGELQRDTALTLSGESGTVVPLQSWPAAYWPDGSVKWTGHAASFTEAPDAVYRVVPGTPAVHGPELKTEHNGDQVIVDTGVIVCRFGLQGTEIIQSITRGGNEVCTGGRLVCLREDRSKLQGMLIRKEQPFVGVLDQLELESSGPVRAVVKATGRHRAVQGGARRWLPFTLRFYLYAGQDTIRVVHTMSFDGDANADYIKGLGITFDVPMSGPLYNRHLRFTGDTGVFSESPKTLATLRTKDKYLELYREQTSGKLISFDPEQDAYFLGLLEESAVWDSFKLVQLSADGYSISKRTKEECCWLHAVSGQRAKGAVYAGSEQGGLGVCLRSFWQKHPAGLEVHGLAQDRSQLTVWFWSPDAQAMDLRHYDTTTHLESSYEGFHELRSTPYGVGNTSELTLRCLAATPSHDELLGFAEETQSPALLVCEPERYHELQAFGVWSLPDRSTELKRALEERLDEGISFFQKEIEQRRWYGFWDFGDVMHSYDPVRHTWRYDMGGCAWQNTELVPNMWLWLMFLRSGREDVFRLAEAMTRHTSEVDTYHFGEYAGLGSRHNVIHWGCGCKEARIGMAGLHRYFYYLTMDERIGDMMEEVKDSDYTTVNLDPMRSYFPKDEFPTHTRVGPDWSAFCSNWMTRWERFEDTDYRDKLLVGWNQMKQMPYRLLTGPTFGYDPKSGELHFMGADNWGRHLMICMGGPQIWFELAETLKDEDWKDMLAEFGAFYTLTPEQKSEYTDGAIHKQSWDHPVFFTGLVAYAAARRGDEALAEKAWSILVDYPLMQRIGTSDPVAPEQFVRPMTEIAAVSTNEVSQWSLNVMVCLELIGGQLTNKAVAKA